MPHISSIPLGHVAIMTSMRGAVSSSLSVQALTSGIVRGDEESFNRFYLEYSPRVFRLLIVVTRGDEELSRELHQSVMIAAARKLKVFEREEELWAWLAQVARNKWKDVCRKRMREARALDSLLPSEITASHSRELVEEALRKLDPPERKLVETFYFDDLSHQQIAQDTGRTSKAVECALARVRQKLRKILTRDL